MFILFDGVKTDEQILAMTASLGITKADIDQLASLRFLDVLGDASNQVHEPEQIAMASNEPIGSVPSASSFTENSGRSPQDRYREAKPLATKLTAGLGLRGFRLNLAIEGTAGYEDLLELLPKLQAAVGEQACEQLTWALKG